MVGVTKQIVPDSPIEWKMVITDFIEPGELRLEGTIQPKEGSMFTDLDVSPEDVEVKYRPMEGDVAQVSQVRTAYSTYIDTLRNAIPGSSIPNTIDTTFSLPGEALSSTAVIGRVQTPHRGQRTDSFSNTLVFPQITIPVPSDFSLVDEMPDIPFMIQLGVTGVFGDIGKRLRSALGGDMSVVFDIPPRMIFNEVSLEDFGCENLFPDVSSDIDSLRTDLDAGMNEARTVNQKVNEISNTVTSFIGGSLQDISAQDITDPGASTLQQAKSRLNNIERPDVSIDSLENRLDSVRDDLQGVVAESDCVSGFSNELDSLESILNELSGIMDNIDNKLPKLRDILEGLESIDCESVYSNIVFEINNQDDRVSKVNQMTDNVLSDIVSRLDSIRDSVNNKVDDSVCRREFLSRINDIESRARDKTEEVIGCSDISVGIRNRVNTLEDDVSNFANKGPSRRREDTKSRLISEATSLEQTIKSQVSDDNPCKSQLLSRVNRAQSRLEEVRARGPEFIPCEEKFPGIEQQVDSFEQQVVGIQTGLTGPEAQELVDNAESLKDQIQNRIPSDDPCRDRLSSRVESAISSLERSFRSVRVRTTVPDEQRQQMEEDLQNLRDQLQGLVEGVETPDRSVIN